LIVLQLHCPINEPLHRFLGHGIFVGIVAIMSFPFVFKVLISVKRKLALRKIMNLVNERDRGTVIT